MEEYTWSLLLPINESKVFADKVTSLLETFNIWTPGNCQIIDFTCYINMINNGLLKKIDYWYVKKNKFGVIILSEFMKYTNDIDRFRTAYSDFSKGWHACHGKRY